MGSAGQVEASPALPGVTDHEAPDDDWLAAARPLRPEEIRVGRTRREPLGNERERLVLCVATFDASPRDDRPRIGLECETSGPERAPAADLGGARSPLPQQAVDTGEQEELLLAAVAGTDVREQVGIVAVEEKVRQPFGGEVVRHRPASSPSSVASRLRPRRVQLLTVPSGTPSRLAICDCERSSK